MRLLFGAYAAVALMLPASLRAADPLYESARRKLDLIEAGKVARGSVISFPPQEINAWARVRVPEIVPQGIRDIRVELGMNTAAGYAIVDFLKMHQAQGQSTNWLISKFIEGERPLKVSVRLESGGGRCTVYLTGVELSNLSANKTVLDFLLNTFFRPLYPDAKIDEPFDLDYNIDRIDIRPTGARVIIRR
jgi:hypothetical protein